MLLSIDRVLQLLTEGKSVDKISELAKCDEKDVLVVIGEARNLLNKYEKPIARKKIILKKKIDKNDSSLSLEEESEAKKIFEGAELGAIPLNSLLIFNTAAFISKDAKEAAIGIQILDENNHQIGKVSFGIGRNDFNKASYYSIMRALRIASYFEASSVRVRSSSLEVIDQINGKDNIVKSAEKKLYLQLKEILNELSNCKFDYIKEYQNDRAIFFAENSLIIK